jgi:uncharacterized membrane protein
MAKRKAIRKQQEKEQRKKQAVRKSAAQDAKVVMPAALFAIKVLSVFLVMILVISLTLYVMGRIPSRGFWILAAILAVIAFLVLPWMRKKFGGA